MNHSNDLPIKHKPKKTRVYVSKQQELDILELYQDGCTMEDIAPAYNIHYGTVAHIVHRHGITAKPRIRLNSEIRKHIVESYLTGESGNRIAKRLEISLVSIFYALRLAGIESRKPKDYRKHTLNDHCFDDAKTNPIAAYWIGFMMADGYVCEKGKSYIVGLCLKASDIEHIHKFQDFLGSDHTIKKLNRTFPGYQTKETIKIEINSDYLGKSLIKYGVAPRKSKTAKVRYLQWNPHFWRGVIDGDGCISIRTTSSGQYAKLSLAGSKSLMEQFLKFSLKIVPRCRVTVIPHSSIWSVTFHGAFAFRMIKKLYSKSTVSLDRKQALTDRIIAEFSPNGKLIM